MQPEDFCRLIYLLVTRLTEENPTNAAPAIIMSTNADAAFDKQNSETDDIPQGGDTVDNSYATNDTVVPVVKDEVAVEQPNDGRNPDSDEALGILFLETLLS